MVEIVVKVGRKSDIIFNNAVVKPRRAITIEEVRSIIKNNTAIQYVILERVEEREYDQLKEFIGEFKGRILFYVTDFEDEETNGIADELSMDVYDTLDKLHEAITRQTGIEVANKLQKPSEDGGVFDTSFYGEKAVEPELVIVEKEEELEVQKVEIEEAVEVVEPEIEEIEVVEEPRVVIEKEIVVEKEIVYVENEEKIQGYAKRIEELENERERLVARSEEIEEERAQVQRELESREKEVQEFKSKGDESSTKVDWYEGKLLALNEELENTRDELNGIIEERNRLASELDSALNEINSLNDKVMAKNDDISKLNERITELTEKINSNVIEIDSMHSNYENERELRSKFERELAEVKELRDNELRELENLRREVSDMNSKMGNVKEPLEREIVRLEESLRDSEERFGELQSRFNAVILRLGGNEDGALKTLERLGELEKNYLETLDKSRDLENKLRASKEQEKMLSELAKGTQDRMKRMENALKKQMDASSSSEGLTLMPIQYTGRAKIIPVYGSGSFGVTTTAVSAAFSLSASGTVALVDFDLDSPKVDAKLVHTPLCSQLVIQQKGKNTALGMLVEKGMDTLKNYFSSFDKRVVRGKYSIDYISGLYHKVPAISFATADFNEFINFLGRQYDYIVMDFGKIGDSPRKIGALNTFADIAYKSIVVTTNHKFEIRSLFAGIAQNKIPGEKGYLINMATNTELVDADKKRLSGSVYTFIPFNMGIFGTERDFFTNSNTDTETLVSHDKFELFMNTLFGR